MKTTYVIGHKNPDTDSICSAIAYANLKTKLGELACPACAGSINDETQYVLDFLKVERPLLVHDFYPKARDIMIPPPVGVSQNDTLYKVGQILKTAEFKSVPILEEDGNFLGIISIGDLAKRFFDEMTSLDFTQTGTSFAAVAEVLGGKILSGVDELDKMIEGRLKIAGSSLENIKEFFSAGDLVLVGDRSDVHDLCIDINVSGIILSGSGKDSKMRPETLKRAQDAGIFVLECSYDTYTCARLINQSIPAKLLMQNKVTHFSPDDLLDDVKAEVLNSHYRNYPVLQNNKLVGFINRNSLILADAQPVILVDHNEKSQAVEGIEYTKVTEIVDHHRLGGMKTDEPIYIYQKPVGCTATIVTELYEQNDVQIDKVTAGLLLAAILSDTVLFKSPTTTQKDKNAVEKLAVLAGLDYQEFGMNLLKAGASLKKHSIEEIVKTDLKEFEFDTYKISISQVYVMDDSELSCLVDDLKMALECMRKDKSYSLSLLMVTNIMTEVTELICVGEPLKIVEYAFKQTSDNGVIHLPGVLSRKKQIVPPLASGVYEIKN